MKRVMVFIIAVTVSLTPSFAKYSGGSGDSNDPYQIANVADLMKLANDVNDYNKCFIITADINLASYTFTTAVIAADINNANNVFDGIPFTGIFDGNGHNIINLTIDTNDIDNDYLGLFGDINGGQVKNLCLKNVYIAGSMMVGAGFFSDYLGSLAGRNGGTISDCCSTADVSKGESTGILAGSNTGSIINCHTTGDVSYGTGLGGLVGDNAGSVNNCYSTADVDGKIIAGGLAGYNTGTISNSYSTGTIDVGGGGLTPGFSDFGGLVGLNHDGNIIDCYSISTVHALLVGSFGADDFGGLVGLNDGGNISGCFAMGEVIASTNIGGLVGNNRGVISNCYSTGVSGGTYNAGGLVGRNDNAISNCYSTSLAVGQSSYGGFAGFNVGTISNCFFLSQVGTVDNGFGEPLTSAQMKQQASFTGWDFSNMWLIKEGIWYPQLKNAGPITHYSGGSGTPEDPYEIATKEDLLILVANAADYSKSFILTADINLNQMFNGAVFAPQSAFTGIFDGNGHKIINIFINIDYPYSKQSGFFGQTSPSASIKNLGLENFYIDGIISGGLVGVNYGSISGCYTKGYVSGSKGYDSYLGGLAGQNLGKITNCYSQTTVQELRKANYQFAGGLVGYNYQLGTISNCYATGIVSGSTITGVLAGKSDGTITSSYFLITGGTNNAFGTPLTDEQMKQQASFAGWDFVGETANGPNDIWRIKEGVSYPRFTWDNAIQCKITLDSNWMYQNLPGKSNSAITAEGFVIDDPCNNSSYSLQWSFELPDDVCIAPITFRCEGGRCGDNPFMFASPGCDKANSISDSGQTFKIIVKVVGNDFGNYGIAEKEFGIALLGDINNDGIVNVTDRSIANTFWRTGVAGKYTFKDCDLNCDGSINVTDRSIANSVWRGALGTNSVSVPCPLR